MAEPSGFLDWGGESQCVYEQWRRASLGGDVVECFLRLGMSLLAPQGWEQGRSVLEVRRRRASIRSGEFSLCGLLLELGVLREQIPPRQRSPELEEVEVFR